DGDPQAASRLLPFGLRSVAKAGKAKTGPRNTGADPRRHGLVHEAYLRLVGATAAQRYADRGHFFAVAAEAMRHILVDNARRKPRAKRGGQFRRVELNEAEP